MVELLLKKGKPLTQGPLVEAIFEVRWELLGDAKGGRYRDPAYPMMYGRLFERMQKRLPFAEDLAAHQVHPEASPYVVRHWMRREKGGYPLVQVGPGVATVNVDRGAYQWLTWKSLIGEVFRAIVDIFPGSGSPFRCLKVELRYLNAIPLASEKESPLSFLQEKLHVQLEMPSDLFATGAVVQEPGALSLNVGYALHRPLGHWVCNFNLGQIDGKPCYLLQSIVQSMGEVVPAEEKLDEWLEEAHERALHSFFSFCKGALLESFSR